MENNNNKNNTNNSPNYFVCEKILSALRVSPAFKTIRRILPICPRETTQNHAKTSIEIQTKINTPQKSNLAPSVAEVVPIEFDDQSIVTQTTYLPIQKKAKVGQNNKEQTQVVQQETSKAKKETSAKKKLDLNDTFSEYIISTRNKIRTIPYDVGNSTLGLDGVHESKRSKESKESVKDHFSDFINHAKGKMKSTSFGSRKNISFKRE